MSYHIAANTGCNLGCTYCYEEPDREMKQKQIDNEYDLDLIMERLEEWKEIRPTEPPGMHGGEPLLLRKEHLEQIFSYIYENWDQKRSHIQTNGTLIDCDHIEMFKKYNVSVGVSCDGPEELNRERVARSGGEDVTDHMTKRTHAAIDRLIEEGIGCGVIVVIHKGNAGDDEKLDALLDWMDYLTKNGASGHFNPAVPYESIQTDISLSAERLTEVFLRTWEWMMEPGQTHRTWNPMRNMQNNLLGLSLKNCVLGTCDVYNAGAAQIIMGNGETTGCGKTWEAVGDGVPFLQGDSTANDYNSTTERYEMLKQIPGKCDPEYDGPDLGGMKGCKYWALTQGGCPAAGIDGDYRNRDWEHDAYHALYAEIEAHLRRTFPAIRLVTDAPWDAPIAGTASSGQLDIQPFGNMTPGAKFPDVVNGFDALDSVSSLAGVERPFEDIVAEYKEKYDPSILTIDMAGKSIHADSTK